MIISTSQYQKTKYSPLRDDLLIAAAPLNHRQMIFWKVTRAVNCSPSDSRSDNSFNIKYFQLKNVLKKWPDQIQQAIKFIENQDQVCVIFSKHGKSRAQYFTLLYLMASMRWKLGLAIQYFQTFNQLSLRPYFITLLQNTQKLFEQKYKLSQRWINKEHNDRKELMINTMFNKRNSKIRYLRNIKETDSQKAKNIVQVTIKLKEGRQCQCKLYRSLILD